MFFNLLPTKTEENMILSKTSSSKSCSLLKSRQGRAGGRAGEVTPENRLATVLFCKVRAGG